MIAADFLQFCQEAGEREGALFALAQDIAILGDALLGTERDLDDALGTVAAISQIQWDMGESQSLEFPFQASP